MEVKEKIRPTNRPTAVLQSYKDKFTLWLSKQIKRNDPIGDFARDTMRIIKWPQLYGAFPKITRLVDLETYLWAKNEYVLEAARSSWNEFSNKKRETISLKVRFEIFRRDDFSCQICGATAHESRLEVDHKHPVSRGGTNDPENLWTLCFPCNRGKGTSTL